MANILTKSALAALMTIGALGASAPAHAASVDIIVDAPHRHHRPADMRRPVIIVPPPIVVRPPVVVVRQGRCAPGLALDKALRSGLNRVAINSVGRNRVTVVGRSHGMWVKMAFANVRGCPRL